MKLASVRKFRSSLSEYGRSGEMVLITNHGKMVGCFLPLAQVKDIPWELKKEFLEYLGREIASELTSKKVAEEDILNDFEKFKKTRRR